ncbi:MAG: hypothetical protein AAF530_08685 [Pseudomonadota bacterium]
MSDFISELLQKESHPIEDVEALLNCLAHVEAEARQIGLHAVADQLSQAAQIIADSARLAENALMAEPAQADLSLTAIKKH